MESNLYRHVFVMVLQENKLSSFAKWRKTLFRCQFTLHVMSKHERFQIQTVSVFSNSRCDELFHEWQGNFRDFRILLKDFFFFSITAVMTVSIASSGWFCQRQIANINNLSAGRFTVNIVKLLLQNNLLRELFSLSRARYNSVKVTFAFPLKRNLL